MIPRKIQFTSQKFVLHLNWASEKIVHPLVANAAARFRQTEQTDESQRV